jgi:uncharacterized protein (UPF0335 family)
MAKKTEKLNPLRTNFDIDFELDKVPYKLTFNLVNKKIKEELDLLLDENKKEFEESDVKRFELKEYLDLKRVNDELLATYTTDEDVKGGITLEQRTALLLENKGYIKSINSLEKEIKNLDKDLKDVNASLEDYYKKMLESCVSGEDKVKFFKAVDEAGISYTLVNVHINAAVRVAQEKK